MSGRSCRERLMRVEEMVLETITKLGLPMYIAKERLVLRNVCEGAGERYYVIWDRTDNKEVSERFYYERELLVNNLKHLDITVVGDSIRHFLHGRPVREQYEPPTLEDLERWYR